MSGSSATVTWTAPDTDGGSPITGYTVTASSDSATATVDGGTHTATLTGLAHAATDTFSVTAANTAGSSDPAASGPASQVLTGTVKAPSGAPVACGTVTIETSDLPTAGAVSWTPTTIGTAVTGSDGTWSFPVPSYASLPAAAQQAATNNNGMLNLDTSASGYAAAGGHTYDEAALGYTSAWVGTATQATPGGPTTPAAMATTMQPLIVTDQSALDTAANELSAPLPRTTRRRLPRSPRIPQIRRGHLHGQRGKRLHNPGYRLLVEHHPPRLGK